MPEEKPVASIKPKTKPANATAPKEPKAAARPAAKKATKTATKAAPKKPSKVKVIRDSFTMPLNEYEEIAKIKEAFKKAGMPVKKSEVLRAGLRVLAKLTAAQKKAELSSLEKIKTGRPNKN
jgi:hypothetical protein